MANRISNLVSFYRAAACIALVLCGAGLEAQTFPAQPTSVSQNPASNSSYPTMVVDALGDINVAWIDNISGINFSRSTNSGQSFLPPVPIAVATVGAVFQPQMLVDSTGKIVEIAWAKPNPAGNFNVFVSRSTDGGLTFGGPTFPAAIQVSTTPVALVDSPRLAFVGAGVDVVWGKDGTWISTSPDGVTFGAPLRLSIAAQDSGGPRIAVDKSGNTFVGWTDKLAEDQNLPGNFCTAATGNPNASGIITVFTNKFGGNFYLNWTKSGTTPSSGGTRSLSSTDWQTVNTDPSYPNGYYGCSYDNLHLFFDQNDNLHLLWADEAPLEDLLTSTATTPLYSNGSPTFSFPIGTSGDEGAGAPNVTTDSSGNFYVVYAAGPKAPVNTEGIYFNRSDNDGASFALPESSVISAPGAISPAYPQVAVDSNGNVNVVWEQPDQPITANGGNTFHLFFARSTDRGNTFPTIRPVPMSASVLCIPPTPSGSAPPTTPDTTTCGTVQMGVDTNFDADIGWVNNPGSAANLDFSVANVTAPVSPDFTISVNSATPTGYSGQTVTFSVSAQAVGGFSNSITLACNNFPAIATAQGGTVRRSDYVCTPSGPLNPAGSVTVGLTIPARLPAGTYGFAINGTSGGTTHRVMVTFASAGPAGSVTPNAANLTVGASANFTVNITQSAFTQTVNLQCSGQPAWIRCSFNPSSIAPSAGSALTSTLTVTVMSAPTTSLLSYPPSRRDLPAQRITALWSATLAALCLIAMLTFSLRRRDNIRTAVVLRGVASMMLTLVLAIGLVSCGGATGPSAANTNAAGASGLTPGSVSSGGSSSSSGSGGTGGSGGGPSSSPVTTTFSVQAQSGNVITNLGTVSITAQ